MLFVKDFGIAKTPLQSRVRRARFTCNGTILTTDIEAAGNCPRDLRRLRELEMDNEVLRRAAADLSQDHIKPQNYPPTREGDAKVGAPSRAFRSHVLVLGFSIQAY